MKRKPILMTMFLAGIFFMVFHSQAAPKQTITFAGEKFVAEKIPFTFDHNAPIAEMDIGGVKVRLIVDTGADAVTIGLKTATLEKLNVQYLNSKGTNADVFGKVYQSRCFVIPSARLGNLSFANLTATEERRDFVQLDGILGNELLKHFYVLIDYSAAAMTLYSKAAYPAELDLANWTKIPFTHNNIGMVVNGRLGEKGKRLKFCFDTGCCVSYQGRELGMIRSQHVPPAVRGESIRIPELGEGEFSSTRAEHFYVENIDLGALEFLVYDFKQPPVDGFIGRNVFSNYQVLIDFDHQLLFFKKAAS